MWAVPASTGCRAGSETIADVSPMATDWPTVTKQGIVQGSDTWGQNGAGDPLYRDVPPPGVDSTTWPKVATVNDGAVLTARCWAVGARCTNYKVDPPALGPSPYESDIQFYVQAPNGGWAWVPDVHFVRSKVGRLGLPACPEQRR